VPGQRHSGKSKLKKKATGLPRVPSHLALGEEFSKKRISSPSVALGEEVFKKKEISSPSVALGEE
jgi:hypothetical protein